MSFTFTFSKEPVKQKVKPDEKEIKRIPVTPDKASAPHEPLAISSGTGKAKARFNFRIADNNGTASNMSETTPIESNESGQQTVGNPVNLQSKGGSCATPNPDRQVLIDRETLEAKEARLPSNAIQPKMRAAKKPLGSVNILSSHATQKTPSVSNCRADSSNLQTGLILETQRREQLKRIQAILKTSEKPAQKRTRSNPSTPLILGKKPPAEKPPVKKRDLLFGSGLTKQLATSSTKAQEKTTAKQTNSELQTEIANENDLDALPDNLLATDLTQDDSQDNAVRGLQTQKYGVLIGAAGTGKTTTMKRLMNSLESSVHKISVKNLSTYKETVENQNTTKLVPAIAFCAFMGKAVQQMKRALPESYHQLTSTIHALLGYAPVFEDVMDKETGETKTRLVFLPSYDEYNKLPYKIIIVDEAGTVSLHLWNQLIRATTSDCRIIIMGDLNQLPPVQGHSVLGFAMLAWPTYVLDKLHRNAGIIAQNAHRILAGKKPLTDKVNMEFIVRNIADGSKSAKKELLCIIQHLHQQGQFDPMQDALIVPQNVSNLGQIELNNVLVNYFNKPRYDDDANLINPRVIIQAGLSAAVFGVGDKVMLLANDTAKQLTNGMVGIVTKIAKNSAYKGTLAENAADKNFKDIDLSDMANEIHKLSKDDMHEEKESERASSHVMHVKFQNVKEDTLFATAGTFRNVAIAYAMTCHKSQGSEYRNVVVVAHASNLNMLTREWLYTAVTRAKQRVVLLTNHRGLTHAINSQRIKGNTIQEKAKKFLALTKKGDNAPEVLLPEPQEIKDIAITFNKT